MKPISSHLDKQAWSIKEVIIMALGEIFLAGHGKSSRAGKIAPYYMASFVSGQVES